MTLLSVDEMRELGRITQEEHWCVVCNHIPIAFLSAELDGETPRVTSTYEDFKVSIIFRVDYNASWSTTKDFTGRMIVSESSVY